MVNYGGGVDKQGWWTMGGGVDKQGWWTMRGGG